MAEPLPTRAALLQEADELAAVLRIRLEGQRLHDSDLPAATLASIGEVARDLTTRTVLGDEALASLVRRAHDVISALTRTGVG